MHEYEYSGILERKAGLDCVARRTYLAKGPPSLVHMDTNHKSIKYPLCVCGHVHLNFQQN